MMHRMAWLASWLLGLAAASGAVYPVACAEEAAAPADMEACLRQLRSDNWRERDEAVESIRSLLNHPDTTPDPLVTLSDALREEGEDFAWRVRELLRALQWDDEDFLEQFSRENRRERVFPLLKFAMELESVSVRRQVILLLKGMPHPESLEIVKRAASDRDALVKEAVAVALADLDPQGASVNILEGLLDEETAVSMAAMETILKLRLTSLYEPVFRRLDDESQNVMGLAVQYVCLYSDGSPAQIELYKQVLATWKNADIAKRFSCQLLARFKTPGASAILLKRLEDPDEYPDVKSAAADGIRELKDPAVVPGLLAVAEKGSRRERAMALDALQVIDPAAAAALADSETERFEGELDELIRTLGAADSTVSQAAREQLIQLGKDAEAKLWEVTASDDNPDLAWKARLIIAERNPCEKNLLLLADSPAPRRDLNFLYLKQKNVELNQFEWQLNNTVRLQVPVRWGFLSGVKSRLADAKNEIDRGLAEPEPPFLRFLDYIVTIHDLRVEFHDKEVRMRKAGETVSAEITEAMRAAFRPLAEEANPRVRMAGIIGCGFVIQEDDLEWISGLISSDPKQDELNVHVVMAVNKIAQRYRSAAAARKIHEWMISNAMTQCTGDQAYYSLRRLAAQDIARDDKAAWAAFLEEFGKTAAPVETDKEETSE